MLHIPQENAADELVFGFVHLCIYNFLSNLTSIGLFSSLDKRFFVSLNVRNMTQKLETHTAILFLIVNRRGIGGLS